MNGRRALRLALALAALAAAALLADSALATSRSERNLGTMNHQVLAAINHFRVAHGLVALRESAGLDRSARQHSLEMGRLGYFAHSSADGTVFWRRIQHYYPAKGHPYWSVGENLAWGAPSLSASGSLKLWIGSAPHLKNLLSRQWRQIGISAVGAAHAPGVYGGQHAVIVTTDFGVRR
ncbi:MAG TPA: CAP domain-containing protein [Solirubrobacteraceae bacterium]|nr:CAP domain-containing protein [Solirubrobacteraceae bacterium]